MHTFTVEPDGFDSNSNSPTATKMATKAIMGIRYRNYTNYTLYRSCLLIYGIAIIRSLSFLYLDDLEGNANISVAIKSGSTVYKVQFNRLFLAKDFSDVQHPFYIIQYYLLAQPMEFVLSTE